MLFNSYVFIFLFLPITVSVYFLIEKKFATKSRLGISWLVITSLFFYGWWNPPNLGVILLSILVNYLIGHSLSIDSVSKLKRKAILVLGIAVNIGLLSYYKYSGFIVDNFNQIFNLEVEFAEIILPLAISFFTFQQIAYLVDVYQGKVKNYRFSDYILFVTFFPQLIAGPIVHHHEIISQFSNTRRRYAVPIAVGLCVFFAGLFKKVIFADGIAYYANAVFDAVAEGRVPTFFESWLGALSYTLQLYFDFSGYSDMAIGAAFIFGIRLPLNFNSPYKSVNIIDFWRRWHITLSDFLKDYLYIPLGGNRKGELRKNYNLLLTMLLAGLWHGAGWTFVLWGGLHGMYLVINHQWHKLLIKWGANPKQVSLPGKLFGCMITFIAVVISWVIFRAENLDTSSRMLASMIALNGISLPFALRDELGFLNDAIFNFRGLLSASQLSLGQAKEGVQGVILLLAVVWLTPNVNQWMGEYGPALVRNYSRISSSGVVSSEKEGVPGFLSKRWTWKPNLLWAVVLSFITSTALLGLTRVSQFLYFQF